ncbi:uncharacterized protein DUF1566 [Desulfobotulus alkaliphilus]|uniref:Uncharacterized protein DUF1566 n=1 Tax=Desulfobotulus alkaliphilus TaxID=622671 RepID=A0A562R257_9BACT|nr:DUF1566 domain-containing protein [Desulfobotulus alkaliphilus]TWI63139.1 uncharacterized protein DUF1566 [Desulfobotulus alkaliphilus]
MALWSELKKKMKASLCLAAEKKTENTSAEEDTSAAFFSESAQENDFYGDAYEPIRIEARRRAHMQELLAHFSSILSEKKSEKLDIFECSSIFTGEDDMEALLSMDDPSRQPSAIWLDIFEDASKITEQNVELALEKMAYSSLSSEEKLEMLISKLMEMDAFLLDLRNFNLPPRPVKRLSLEFSHSFAYPLDFYLSYKKEVMKNNRKIFLYNCCWGKIRELLSIKEKDWGLEILLAIYRRECPDEKSWFKERKKIQDVCADYRDCTVPAPADSCRQEIINKCWSRIQPLIARFEDKGDGTVTDRVTGLQWMRCALGQTWDRSRCNGTPVDYGWEEAMEAARKCRFAGKNDWRLPDIHELQSLAETLCHYETQASSNACQEQTRADSVSVCSDLVAEPDVFPDCPRDIFLT